ncbi:MAG: hypothetical protein HY554_03590 [Elusimicrobia bacterium]|nr:hypothetical protein [Elusimicrobiota bacterium]
MPFEIRIVTEEACKFCEPTLADDMARLHPGAKIRSLDHQSKEGRELLERHQARTLPVYVLDAAVEQDPNFQRLLPVAYYKSQGSYLIRHGPTNFYPNVQLDRKRTPRHLDLFFESLSGSSAQAEADFMRFLIQNEAALKDLTFSIHFLATESLMEKAAPAAQGPSIRTASLAELPREADRAALTTARGEAEVQEDIRQLCLFQHSGIGTYFTYLNCRNKNLADPEQADRCLQPGERVRRCMDSGEGKRLLLQDARLAKELALDRAPVLLWENRYGPFAFNETDWRSLLLGRVELSKGASARPKAQ